MPTAEPNPTDADRRKAEAKRPKGKEIEELNRETLPKTPDGKVIDPKQKEVEGSAG